ncbi:hypothetical protein EW146_g3711 [Bondarzewia mesenterica]|uniref:Uncharacterized protein n=1 Tax=Bondarzewia mesenterica TaxID=1095465 RepID=A0A4S4LY06_9AGAM|nr:hypothetical protein EW146_g3711 [Bondarzewia mesenterica]
MERWRKLLKTIQSSRRGSPEDYELLVPDSEVGLHLHRKPRRACLSTCWQLRVLTFRRLLLAFSLIPVFAVMALLWSGIPPNYDDIRQFERQLPQHNLSLPAPEGKSGAYLRFPDHLWGHGLNNVLQEIILMSHLAHLVNRSYVFEDYTWSHLPLPYTIYDFALRPTKIPLNAFISGPSAGGPMPVPRAVNVEYWNRVCHRENTAIISSQYVPIDADGSELIGWWVDQLSVVQANCVQIDSAKKPVFDKYLFGSKRLLSLWPSLSASPVLANYTWSPLVHSAVSRNFALLQLSVADLADAQQTTAEPSLSGLVAVHIRRGDYKRHCPRLATWGALYMGFNEFAELPDRFDPQPYTDAGERLEYYLRHCLPEVEQIVERLHTLRDEHPDLKRVYVLNNAWGWWLDGLESALKKDGWEDVVGSAGLTLDAEQKYVAMAVDMAIAEKAEVFVGNGFSSLTSNIVMLRLAKGMDPRSNRFL